MANNGVKRFVLRALALCLCTLPVAVCILSYFPLWIDKGGAHVLSGFAVLLCVLAFSPFYKYLRAVLRSPSSYTLWLIAFIVFLILSKIADEMTVISFVGFIGNLLGAMLFKWADRYTDNSAEKEDRK